MNHNESVVALKNPSAQFREEGTTVLLKLKNSLNCFGLKVFDKVKKLAQLSSILPKGCYGLFEKCPILLFAKKVRNVNKRDSLSVFAPDQPYSLL